MEIPKIFESEYHFCEILWEHEPVSSSELVRLCNEKLEWKKSTTYTVIRRLSERGVIQSENAIVTSDFKGTSSGGRKYGSGRKVVFGFAPQLYCCFCQNKNAHS